MGVATGGEGGWGNASPCFKILGDVPPEIAMPKGHSLKIYQYFRFPNIFKRKWVKSEQKPEYGVRWFLLT